MQRFSRRATTVALCSCALVSLRTNTAATAQVQYNTVALSGSAGTTLGLGPNLGAGTDFLVFQPPSINADGKVAFSASLTGTAVTTTNRTGIWSNVGGPLSAIARTGDSAGAGLPAGTVFSSTFPFEPPVISDDGVVSFTGFAEGPGEALSVGIWHSFGTSLAPVARSGEHGPGPNLGAGITFAGSNRGNLNTGNYSTARTTIQGTGVDASNNSVIWSNVSGSVSTVARTGTSGPGPNLAPGVYFTSLNDDPIVNPSGRVAFSGKVAGTGIVAGTNDAGIWSDVAGTLMPVAQIGVTSSTGPNLGGAVVFSNVRRPNINSSGTLAFNGSVSGDGITGANASGIWTSAGGTNSIVARSGPSGTGPGIPGVYFRTFGEPVINDAGDIAFQASLAGQSEDSDGIWISAGGSVQPVARSGSNGPLPVGVPAGVVFAGFSDPAMNASGDVAFLATLTGPGVSSANDQGLWAYVEGTLYKIAREGDSFDVDPGPSTTLRTITTIGLAHTLSNPSGGSDGRPEVLNDEGMLVFRLGFNNNSAGIFTAVVPEPTCLVFVGAASLAWLGRRRRRPSTR